MKINVVSGAPIAGNGRGRWTEVWDAVVKAEPQWVKVSLETEREAHQLRMAATTHRRFKMETRLSGCDVYLRMLGHRPS